MKLVLLKSIFKFYSTKRLFNYFKQRYDKHLVKLLNSFVGLQGQTRHAKSRVRFLRSCIINRVLPSYLYQRIKHSQSKTSRTLEEAFLHDEIETKRNEIAHFRTMYRSTWSKLRNMITTHDMIRLCLYVSKINERLQIKEDSKCNRQVKFLMKQRYGGTIRPNDNLVINLSQHQLSENEKFVLEHGLDFCVPPKYSDKCQLMSEFEILFSNLHPHHRAISEDSLNSLRAKLASIAHDYSDVKPSWPTSPFHHDHYEALRDLRSNKNIVIVKADKDGSCVILNKADYVSKMMEILGDETKFKRIGPVAKFDNTRKIEKDFQKYLLSLKKKALVSESILDAIRPVGSQRARLYGKPKTHKKGVPLRPVLSTVNSSQRPVADYLKDILSPVLDKFSSHSVKDSYTFANDMKTMQLCEENYFMCSFDIKSLFTNIPLQEVIQLCADTLYHDENISPPPFSKDVFIKLLEFATCGVEFSFDGIMYKQTDGLGMGGVLSSILSNIYVGHLEYKIFKSTEPHHPLYYKRYADDTFAIFKFKYESLLFFTELNSASNLEFTMEEEENSKLPFLDVLVQRKEDSCITSVYRKPTFSGSYLRWNSFSPYKRKVGLIEILTHRAIHICSTSTLSDELNKIRSIFEDNGYPASVIDKTIRQKLAKSKIDIFGPKKQAVYLKLPYKGFSSENIPKIIKSTVESTFYSVNVRVIFSTQKMLPSSQKDTLPNINKSAIVYQFTCNRCESEYIGKSSRQLCDRISEHVPSQIRRSALYSNTVPSTTLHDHSFRQRKVNNIKQPPIPSYDISAVRLHLLENPACAAQYNVNCFKILAQGRSTFHLSVLESMYINNCKPILCRKKDFIYSLKLFPKFYSY